MAFAKRKRSSRVSHPLFRKPKPFTLFPSIPQNLHYCPPASQEPSTMADKEIVPYVAPESRQDDHLSPMEQYFTEALQEEIFSVSTTLPAMPQSTPRRNGPSDAKGRSADHLGRPTSPRACSALGFSGGSPSPGGALPVEVRRSKPRNRPSKKKLEVFAVKLFQDENALGPRLKPDEEYVHSWVTKEGRIISHCNTLI